MSRSWKESQAHLVCPGCYTQYEMPVIYQQQDTHKERKYGLRPPEVLRNLVERMKGVDWLAKHYKLAFDDDWLAASPDIAVHSRGKRWYEKGSKQGKRFVIQGCTSIDKDTG